MMNKLENSDSIPTDLFLEIFSRLPAKSIGRFRCVSKQLNSILHNRDFTDLFFTKSSARPRLLFGVELIGECFLFSSPQSSNSSTLDFHTKFVSEYSLRYGCGLIYLRNMWIEKENKKAERIICNPITGQYTILPELRESLYMYSYLGFDPIDKQFKLLVMNTRVYIAYSDSVHHILTLGSGDMKWRNVQCPFTHEPFHERICINGVLYYLAGPDPDVYPRPNMIVCFDVRSEEFKFIYTERSLGETKLVNYKGKLGVIRYESEMRNLKLRMWVLEDLEKQEWSNFVYTVPENEVVDSCYLSVVGVTASGEFVLFKQFTSKPFYVFYFNPERNTLQCVEIHGNHQLFENQNIVYVFVDHVEDLKFDIMRAATSISPPEEHQAITEEADKSCKVISGRLSR